MADPTLQKVQAAVNAAGYSPALATDGVFGPKTQAGIQWYQSSYGLPVTGQPDAATLKKMGISGVAKTGPTIDKVPSPTISGVKPAVTDSFMSFTGQLEGNMLPYMYTDSYGLVTTGSGNLIDSGARNDSSGTGYGPALSLTWKRPDGSLASQQEIIDAWLAVKQAWPDVQSVASQSLTNLRLDNADISKLIVGKLSENVDILRTKYPGFINWPADAQLGLLSMAWAMGPAFNFPAFTAAVNQQTPDFITAATQSHMSNGAPERNAYNNQLFTNAAQVLAMKANPNTLFFPDPVTVAAIALATGLIMTLGAGGVAAFLWYKKLWPFGAL